MTPEQLRELDAQVQREVFRSESVTQVTRSGSSDWYYNPDLGDGEREHFFMAVPEYSKDEFVQVVDAILHNGRYVRDDQRTGMADCHMVFNPYKRTWEVKFSWSSSFEVRATAHDLSVAICCAARLANAPSGTYAESKFASFRLEV